MVEHIVLFRWTKEASQETVDNALAELRGLQGKIPGIVDISSGVNSTDRPKATRTCWSFVSRIGPRCKHLARTRSISALCKTLSVRFAPILWSSITSYDAGHAEQHVAAR